MKVVEKGAEGLDMLVNKICRSPARINLEREDFDEMFRSKESVSIFIAEDEHSQSNKFACLCKTLKSVLIKRIQEREIKALVIYVSYQEGSQLTMEDMSQIPDMFDVLHENVTIKWGIGYHVEPSLKIVVACV